MTLRQDHQLAQIDAYALDKSDNALLLKYIGAVTTPKVAKSKLMDIDSATKALLVRFIDGAPPMTGAQIVAILEALEGDFRLSHTALGDIVSSSHHTKYTNAEAVAAVEAADPLDLQDDVIKDSMIDFGTGANQVSGVDVPIADAGAHYPADNVEAALQQAASNQENAMALIYLGL